MFDRLMRFKFAIFQRNTSSHFQMIFFKNLKKNFSWHLKRFFVFNSYNFSNHSPIVSKNKKKILIDENNLIFPVELKLNY